jgi:uncharacterized membrane protein YcaP (DUF421 family)
MFFQSWMGVGRVLLVGTLAYLALVFILRVSGKRTLSKLNAFDLVVTVALGSTLATVLLSKDVALVEGVVAFALLIFLQYVMAWSSVRSQSFETLIKSEPTLLVRSGQFLEHAMRLQRITREEVEAAMRGGGASSPADVAAVVLETDGSISVIPARDGNEDTLGSGRLVDFERKEGGTAHPSS